MILFFILKKNKYLRYKLSTLRVLILVLVVVYADLANAQTQLSLTSDLNLLYHEKGSRQAWDIWFVSNQVEAKLRINETPVFLTIHQKKDFISFSNFKENQNFTLVSSSTEFLGGLHFSWNKFEIDPCGIVSIGNNTYRPGGGFLLKYEILTGLKLLGGARIRPLSYSHRWKVEDIKPEFQQWGKVTEYQLGLNWVWKSGFLTITHQPGVSSVSGQKQTFSERGDYKNQTTLLETFAGIGNDFWVQADIRLYNGWGFPEWSYKQFPFSGFEDGSVTHHFADGKLISSKNKNWKPFLGIAYRELSLKAGGFLQSHPFTPAIFSLIGDYYFFSIDQIVRIPEIYLGSDYHSDGLWSASFSIGWQRARPKLKIQTWEPLFFLFGRKNEKTTPFSYQFVDIIPVKTKISIPYNKFLFECEISQEIPVHAVKNRTKPSTANGGGSSTPSSGTSSPKTDKSVWGGTNLKLSASFDF